MKNKIPKKCIQVTIQRDLLRKIMPEALPLVTVNTSGHYLFSNRANLEIACALFAKLDPMQFATCCLASMQHRYMDTGMTDNEKQRRDAIFKAVSAWLSATEAYSSNMEEVSFQQRKLQLEDVARIAAYEFQPFNENTTSYHRDYRQIIDLGLLPSAISQAQRSRRDVYWLHIGGSGAQIIRYDDHAINHCMTALLAALNKWPNLNEDTIFSGERDNE